MAGGTLLASIMAALLPMAMAEEEKAPAVDIAIAATLIGAVSFQMGLFHLTNHHDPEMRKYSYTVINQTVSIFCSVLMFQTFNDIVDANILEGASAFQKFVVNWFHMLFWFIVLQVVLARVCGVIGPKPKSIRQVEHFAKSAGTLLAHMTGFASINAWGSLQQLEYFRSSPGLSFMVLPISFGGQFLLQRLTDNVRYKVAMADGEESEFEEKWDEETEEAENDIMGLTISFNLAQAIRFANSDYLPDQEGVEPMEVIAAHSAEQVWRLWAVALMFAIFLGIMNFLQAPEDLEAEDKKHEEGHKETGHHMEGGHHEEKSSVEHLKERAWEVTMLAWSMAFAWCCFYSAKMSLAKFEILDDNMILSMALSLVISLVSFSMIRVLDLLADLDSTGPRVDHTIFQIIRAIGLVVGFAWEQTFDQAVESLSTSVARPHLAKFFLAVFCVLVIVPAWYEYILPMAITENWEWNFLVRDLEDPKEQERWEKVVDHIVKQREAIRKEDSLKEPERRDSRDSGSSTGKMTPRKSLTMKITDMKGTFTGKDSYQGAPYTKLSGGGEFSEVEELRAENRKLKEALESQLGSLRDREKAEHQRAHELQAKDTENSGCQLQ